MKISKISLLGIALLVGCTPEVVEWSPAESPKENKVDRAVFTYPIPYSVRLTELNSLEKAKFCEFLKTAIPRPYSVRVTLVEYGGHSDKRLKDIERMLLIHGVPLDSIYRNFDHVDESFNPNRPDQYPMCKKGKHRHTHTKASGSVVLLVVERFVVITPSCANFLEQIGDASQAYNSSNFGCSTEANLGMMIANPQDLLRGRDRDPYDGAVLAAGVNRYENDKIKDIVRLTTTTMQSPIVSGGSNSSGGSSGGSGGGGY